MTGAQVVLTAAEIWAWTGVAVAVVFLGWGIDRVEPNARGAYVFRPLMLPGIVLLWPLVLWRWRVLETGRDRPLDRHRPARRLHGVVWSGLAWAIPAILIAGMLVRQNGPLERPAVLLEPPAAEATQ